VELLGILGFAPSPISLSLSLSLWRRREEKEGVLSFLEPFTLDAGVWGERKQIEREAAQWHTTSKVKRERGNCTIAISYTE
jgi:hypothetical protein